MSNPEDPSTESPAPSAPPILDSNVQQSQTPVASRFSITRSWRIEDLYKNGSLALHGSGLLFSFLAFIIMVTNKHGDGRNFLDFEEYRYLVAIAILSTLYTGGHVFLQLHESLTNKQMFSLWNLAFFNFVGDQKNGIETDGVSVKSTDYCILVDFGRIISGASDKQFERRRR
ncbi:hypothetical protein AgCh_017438 [Apium graveolens]